MTRRASRHNASPSTQDLRARVGRKIAAAQDELDIRNRVLADAVGIDVRLLQKHKAGHNMPGEANLLRYARVLGHPVSWFFAEDEVAA